MATIIFKGWEVGMRGIPFMKLLTAKANISLKKAMEIKIRIVENEVIELNVKDTAGANEIIKEAHELGVLCELKA